MSADEWCTHGAGRLRRLLRALQARNYRLYIAGQSLSLIGTWMQGLALSWWVYRSTHSALVLGIVIGTGQLPAVLLAPLAGALVDRWDRQRLLVVTQLLAMLQAIGLGCLVGALVFARYLPVLRALVRPNAARPGAQAGPHWTDADGH